MDDIDAMISQYNAQNKIARPMKGRHRKGRSLARTITVGAVTFVAAGMVTAFALGASPAHAATVHRPVNWTARTHTAFNAWDKHRTLANLNTLTVDATHLPVSWLRTDVLLLSADASSPGAKPVFISEDAKFVELDF